MNHYAGIGSRSTPTEILSLMTRLARMLERKDFILRSGHADGADKAFEEGVYDRSQMQIFLPWHTFNNPPGYSALVDGEPRGFFNIQGMNQEKEAAEIAEEFHPNWGACSRGARLLHTRNVFQVLGHDLKTPSKFVICWTPGASRSGGTGQALRIADAYKIPIFDLADEVSLKTVLSKIKE